MLRFSSQFGKGGRGALAPMVLWKSEEAESTKTEFFYNVVQGVPENSAFYLLNIISISDNIEDFI
jgi:hypothetical protein